MSQGKILVTDGARVEEALRTNGQRVVGSEPESQPLPEGDLGDLELAEIIDVESVRSLLKDFHDLVHIPMAVIDTRGNVLVGEGWQEICTKFHRTHGETRKHCVESDVLLSAGIPPGEARLYKCRNDMWEAATPIVIGGKHMGNVFSGQFFFDGEMVDRTVFRARARKFGFDEKEYLAALDAVPRLGRDLVDRAMSFFTGLAQTLSQLSYSNIKLAKALSRGEALTDSLQQAKEEWERTFDSVPDMIAILDNRHRIVRVNAAMAKRLGMPREQCVGSMCYELIHSTKEPPGFCPHVRTMKDGLQHIEEVHEKRLGGDFEVTTTPLYDEQGLSIGSVHVAHDITAHKRAEKEQELTVRFLSIANRSVTREELVRDTLAFFHKESGCEAVGIRLKEDDRYPYFETKGIPQEFALADTSLCGHGRTDVPAGGEKSCPTIGCICSDVIQGRIDTSKPFNTAAGSFWTNSTTELLAASGEEERQGRLLNRCSKEGYESIALIPLRVGQRPLGLIQMKDRRKGRFSPESIALAERVAGYLSVALAKVEAEEALRGAKDELEQRVRQRTEELQKAYDRLMEETVERRLVEGQLRQAQKMDALGIMSGGIAHDFNNILAAIMGFADIVRGHLPQGSRDARSLERVMEAGIRGRELIKQMLAFSRKGDLEKKPLAVAGVVNETMKLLRASIPTTIDIEVKVERESGMILGDPVQLQQVLMNLATNAAHAMREKGGSLTVDLTGFSASPGNTLGLQPGPYLKLLVKDTGDGIPEDDMEKIFDPFFTTKKQGEGTGLGLSVVHGIVRQLDGRIMVESRLGEGSSFSVFFPKIEEKAMADNADGEAAATGHERILFVDDEEPLAEMGADILQELGYQVAWRTGSRAALALFRLDPSRFDLVITDQTMPEMAGIGACPSTHGYKARYSRHPLHGIQPQGRRRRGSEGGYSSLCNETAHKEGACKGRTKGTRRPLSG